MLLSNQSAGYYIGSPFFSYLPCGSSRFLLQFNMGY
jgi:hypothetical protein